MKYLFKILCFFSFFMTGLSADESTHPISRTIDGGFTYLGYDLYVVPNNPPPFPIELGRRLTLKSKKHVQFPGKSYQAVLVLEDKENGGDFTFSSRMINNEPFSMIHYVYEKKREVKKNAKGFQGVV